MIFILFRFKRVEVALDMNLNTPRQIMYTLYRQYQLMVGTILISLFYNLIFFLIWVIEEDYQYMDIMYFILITMACFMLILHSLLAFYFTRMGFTYVRFFDITSKFKIFILKSLFVSLSILYLIGVASSTVLLTVNSYLDEIDRPVPNVVELCQWL